MRTTFKKGDKVIDEWVDLYEWGMSFEDISLEYGSAQSTIRRHTLRAGLVPRVPGEKPGGKKVMRNEFVDGKGRTPPIRQSNSKGQLPGRSHRRRRFYG